MTPALVLLGRSPSLRLLFVLWNVSFLALYLFHYPLYWLSLKTRVLSTGPCQCFYIFVPYPAFRVHAAGGLIQKISFAADILPTSFARALLGIIRKSPRLYLESSTLKNIIPIRLNVFLQQYIYIEHWIWIAIYAQFPFENNFNRNVKFPVTRANINEPSSHKGLTGVIIALWHTLRGNGRVPMKTRSLLRYLSHRARIRPARMKANGNFSDANLKRLHFKSV